MSNHDKVIFVTGSTGQQGGAAARHLLARGWSVRALTRNTNSPAAQALAKAGAEVVEGDLEDRASIDTVLDGVYGVFSFPNMAMGIEGEVRHGKTMADAAKAAGVAHFVQGSVGGVERNSGVPHFESKWQIEEHVRSLGLPATFLRPVYFMENLSRKRTQILDGTYESIGMDPGKSLQMIAVDDIGVFVTLTFEHPEMYTDRALELAGDELTEAKMVDILGRVVGKEVKLTQPQNPPAYADMVVMIDWFNENGYEADIPALKLRYPGLMDFEAWLMKNGWAE